MSALCWRVDQCKSITTRPPAHAGCHRVLHLRTVWGCGPDARLRKRADRLRGALWPGGWGALPGGGLFARGSGPNRLRGCAMSTRTARQRRQGPPTRPCGGRTPRETRQNLPVDALRQASQDGAAMNEREKQFSFTRAAPSTSGRAKKQIPAISSFTMRSLNASRRNSGYRRGSKARL